MTDNPLEKRRASLEEAYFVRENAKKLAAIRDGLIGRPSTSQGGEEDQHSPRAPSSDARGEVSDAA